MTVSRTTFAGLFAAFMLSCTPPPQETEVKTPAPPTAPAIVDSLVPLPSVVNIPIRIRTSVIEDMLNKQLSGILYACDTLTMGVMKNVKLKVWKGDSIRLTLEGNELRYKTPLKLWMQFAFTVGALGLSHTEYEDVEAALALKFTSRVSIARNWKMSTVTRAQGYEWISNPVVKVRFLTIPVKPIADIILASQQKNFSDLIDNQVDKVLSVKNMLLPLWSQLQDPLLISPDPKVWLTISPQEIYMTPLAGRSGAIVSAIGIKSVVSTCFGDKPVCTKMDSLPDFQLPKAVDSTFVLNLYSEMNYDAATNLLRGFLTGRQFSSGKKEVVIKDVTMAGVQGYALICLDLIGSYEGRIFVHGMPKFDTATSIVSIEDLDFDLSTKNVIHKTANWLLHSMILSSIKPYLKFPLREKLLESQLMVQKMLCHSELSKNVYIIGSLDSLKVAGVRLTDSAMRATIFAKGKMALSAHE
jgi:hypothetical protein